jgi:hypothetical protein
MWLRGSRKRHSLRQHYLEQVQRVFRHGGGTLSLVARRTGLVGSPEARGN